MHGFAVWQNDDAQIAILIFARQTYGDPAADALVHLGDTFQR